VTDKGACFHLTVAALNRGSRNLPLETLKKMENVYAVHGFVRGTTGKPVMHSWLEFNTGKYRFAWDSSMDRVFNRAEYYDLINAKPKYRLTPERYSKLRNRFKHPGYYTQEELRSIK